MSATSGDASARSDWEKRAGRRRAAEVAAIPELDTPSGLSASEGRGQVIYEMVLRRCHLIVVSDGSQDKGFDFESLGNAMSKIRTDLGIRITFNSIPISPREEKIPTFVKVQNGTDQDKKKYCAVGRIHYSDVDEGDPAKIDGFLLYIKPAIYGIEPADVQNYARANPDFPHETTGDQMYSETQFESYRALGFHEASNIASELTKTFGQTHKEMPGEETNRKLRE